LRARILPHASLVIEEKIAFSADRLEARIRDWRKHGLRVGFTNGCFDILHPGHVKVITDARAACDRLIVAINTDASVRRLKGADRPLQNERARAEVLAALEAVDLVVIFDEDTPLRLIEQIEPSVLVKGGDYTREQVVGHEVMDRIGGEVLLVETVPGFSTTSLVDRAKNGA
jgi:D-beta-D-heptose 7-phosphate kinase/D-beta-D-heptose 1-phosphate adenosyltransferase